MANRVSPFEAIRKADAEGNEYWSARDLARVLGYVKWDKFAHVIEKAVAACENSGHAPSDHLLHAEKLIQAGKGAQRAIEDWHLSRYACYLVIQNADPAKEIVALGQTYFAVQTRRQELTDELAGLPEDQRRLYLRGEVALRNVDLAEAARAAGVVTKRDFAIFQDSGYRGLYNGETARDIAARKGLPSGQRILDHMSSEELAANWFRATQAEAKLRRDAITGKEEANTVHLEAGRVVRRAIAELGGTMPEELPTPEESIQQVQRREQKRLEAKKQPPLFPEP